MAQSRIQGILLELTEATSAQDITSVRPIRRAIALRPVSAGLLLSGTGFSGIPQLRPERATCHILGLLVAKTCTVLSLTARHISILRSTRQPAEACDRLLIALAVAAQLGLPRFGGQVSGLHGFESTGVDELLLVVDWAEVTDR